MAKTPAKAAPKKPAAPRAKASAAKAPIKSVNTAAAKEKFSKALDDAKAGAAALGSEARTRAEAYRDQAVAKSSDWVDEAKVYGEQAKKKAGELAVEGKTRASDALSGFGKLVSDNAVTIDDRFGEKYGDYARTASRKLQETAARIDAKEIDELGEDAREFVRKSPALAVGIAAVAGFFLARLFSGSNKA
ncbi:MAG: hypothetical protein P0Y56_02075 [Candidatus Andeanibacterium colombiense]|uniref:DUF883 domain-containing protein n=1 Tax=Candidatus Andeanibacterium colombiense TaxID=3121345 RepID=A0AAJ6BQ39_9SPHN|nr:MAG: hypothetical protein P0Y56_02075 [Sphingomonadaceae bacterium]